jgi:hypothetical protein
MQKVKKFNILKDDKKKASSKQNIIISLHCNATSVCIQKKVSKINVLSGMAIRQTN